MPSLNRQLAVAIGCVSILTALTAFAEPASQPVIPGNAPATQPSTNPSRTTAQIRSELIKVSAQIQAAGGSSEKLADAEKRSQAAPKLIPLVKRQSALLDEYGTVAGAALPPSALDGMKQHNRAMLYLLHDPATVDHVNTAAEGADSDTALDALSTRLMSQWIAAGKDEDAQAKLIDEIEKLDVAHPQSTQLTMFTFMLSRDAATNELADRLMSIATDKMNNKVATALKPRIPLIQQARAAAKPKNQQAPRQP